jgi:hypothetical protein
MSTSRFLAIVSILIILSALPLALHSLHECLERTGMSLHDWGLGRVVAWTMSAERYG